MKIPDDNIHIMPDDDFITHIESESCQCVPKWDKENKSEFLRTEADCKVFLHNRLKDQPPH